jgi:hypothetical protein
MEYWSDCLSLVNSKLQRISMTTIYSYRRSVLGFRFSNTPALHEYVEKSRVMESPLPGRLTKAMPSRRALSPLRWKLGWILYVSIV